MKRLLSVVAALVALTGCDEVNSAPRPGETRVSQTAPYDVRPLLEPKKKYLGVAYDGAGRNPKALAKFTRAIGKSPNMTLVYADFDDPYPKEKVTSLWEAGVLSVLVWEPFKTGLDQIGNGERDDFIRKYADTVRELNIPVVINFAHEMNGYWYPWGTKKTAPADFLKAHRHVHDVFLSVGATNVIWLWSPNVPLDGRKEMALRPYWPGPNYVDWVGPVGYYVWTNKATTFEGLFGPTIKAVRRFTDRPILLAETAVPVGSRKAAQITDLYRGAAVGPRIIGVVWFNFKKEKDWRIQSDPASLNSFREAVSSPRFGFDPRAVR